ncbi:MAG TPA: tetratricopeptide repeat protein [Myxococcota bacterium]|nr:tetratricopeptide repeat protein [Myxococcota bacterium]
MRRLWFLAVLGCLPVCSDEARVERAEVALRAGDYSGAEADFREVLDDDPDNVDALYGLGWTYHLVGQRDRAREYFKRCVRLAPDDFRGHRGLGAIALSDGNPMLARTHLDDALEKAPGEPRVLNSLGLAHLAEGDEEAALRRFEEALAGKPSSGEFGYNVAEVQVQRGDLDTALVTVDAALSGDIEELRFRGLLLELRARVLVGMTAGRVDANDCEATAPPVLTWLAAADRALDQADTEGIDATVSASTRRQVHRRRSVVTEWCPAAGPR